MKYDRKEIMKRAWEIKKDTDRRTLYHIRLKTPQADELKPEEKAIFGECLRLAWVEAKKAEISIPKMPQLEGSVKQVKWAEDIRKKALEKLIDLDPDSENFKQTAATIWRDELNRKKGYSEYMPDMQKRDKEEALGKLKLMYMDALNIMASITDATWFIRERYVTIFDLFPDKNRDEKGFLKKY